MKHGYMRRIADKILEAELESSGAVLIEGPKWCGKTRTASERAASVLYMQDPDLAAAHIKAAAAMPSTLLDGANPRLLDEWQMAPVLWDAVRFAVDKSGDTGLFILTGSAVPRDNAVMHTGTGRISRMLMRPMSLFESLESSGEVSLLALFDGETDAACSSSLTIRKLAYALTRGGWPAGVGEQEQSALRRVRSYVNAVINIDVSRVDGVEKNPARVGALMRSLARNVSTPASIATIQNDMSAGGETVSEKTVSSYLNALRRIFAIEDLPAWSPAMRSKTAVRTGSKRHFVDPSIAAAVLRATPDKLLRDFNTFGFLFESLCVRDLRVYANAIDGEVFHYRDKSGLEADAIVQLNDGRWGAFEIKMGAAEIDAAAENLKKLHGKINVDRMNDPSFLAVLTATAYGYRRGDGIYVVPVGCLKP